MEILVPHTPSGDDKVVVLSLSQDEEAALLAAGRAAGCTDLKSVIYGVLDDAIGIGCRVLRVKEDDDIKRKAEEEEKEMLTYARDIRDHFMYLEDKYEILDQIELHLENQFPHASQNTITNIALYTASAKLDFPA